MNTWDDIEQERLSDENEQYIRFLRWYHDNIESGKLIQDDDGE